MPIRRMWVFVLLFFTAACGLNLSGEPEIVVTLVPATPAPVVNVDANITQGQSIYAENCVRCHGISGRGDGEFVLSGQVTDVADFTNYETMRAQPPQRWFNTITNGNIEKLMPPWGDALTEQERWSVAMFTYTLAYDEAMLAQGEEVWTATCSECHGADGAGGDRMAVPDLTDLAVSVRASDDMWFDQVTNGKGEMPAFTDDLSEEQRLAAVMYARTLALTSGESTVPVEVAEAAPASANSDANEAAPQEEAANAEPESVALNPGENAVMSIFSGVVTNSTQGANVPANTEAVLHIIDESFRQEVRMVTLDDSDVYTFEDVPNVPGWHYYVSVQYDDNAFNSALYQGDPEHSTVELPVEVMDTTTDDAVITIGDMITQIEAQPDAIMFTQIITIHNRSDSMYLNETRLMDGQLPVSVIMPIPEGAELLRTPQDQMRFFPMDEGRLVADTRPVLPDEPHIIHLVYTMPYGEEIDFSQRMMYAVDGKMELLAQSPITVSSNNLTLAAVGDEGAFSSYGGNIALAANDSLQFALNMPADAQTIAAANAAQAAQAAQNASAPATTPGALTVPVLRGDNTLRNVLLILGAASMLIGVMLFLRDWMAPLSGDLVKQIAELDTKYKEGKLNEDVYQTRRRKLKARLAKSMKQ